MLVALLGLGEFFFWSLLTLPKAGASAQAASPLLTPSPPIRGRTRRPLQDRTWYLAALFTG
jgi:hypothetical protein